MKNIIIRLIVGIIIFLNLNIYSQQPLNISPPEIESLYTYRAHIIKVYDGDTVTCLIDLGFKITMIKSVRLLYINSPEVRGKERKYGLKSRDWLRERIMDKDVYIKTKLDKTGKYGRILAEIWIQDLNGNWLFLNDLLVKNGYAEYKDYEKRKRRR